MYTFNYVTGLENICVYKGFVGVVIVLRNETLLNMQRFKL